MEDLHKSWCQYAGCDCGLTTWEQSVWDLQQIAKALGIFDGARPYPPHEFVEKDILPAIRELRQGVVPDGVIEHLELQQSLITRLLKPKAVAGQEPRDNG